MSDVKEAAPDVAVPRSFPLSKTKALDLLKRGFRHPGFQNVTTAEDKAAGNERWRVYCLGDNAVRLGVVDVAGPAESLAKAALIAAYRRIHIEVKFVNTAKGREIRFDTIPLKPAAPPPEPD